MTESIPVLIIGGGPTGLAMSLLLSRAGVRSLLVERHPGTTDHPRAHVVATRTMELFRQWGIADAVIGEALPLDQAGGITWAASLAGERLGHLDLTGDETRLEARLDASPIFTVSCAQDRIEPILYERARTEAATVGSHIEFETLASLVDARPDGATVQLVGPAGTRTVTARYVVAADGASSPTRAALGIQMSGHGTLGHHINTYFTADLSPWVERDGGVLHWIVDAEASGVFIALDGKRRWLFNSGYDPAVEPASAFTPERCASLVRRAVGASDLELEIRSIRPWAMDANVADAYRSGSVFLAGDAAHTFPPTGGLGMNTGVQDAHNLAWKLAWVLQGRAGAALLDTYDAERRPVARSNTDYSVVNAIGASTTGIGPMAPEVARILAAGGPAADDERRRLAAAIEQQRQHFDFLGQDLGFSYETGALVADDTPPEPSEGSTYVPSARPGARAPHAWATRGDQRLSMLDLFDGSFTLLVPVTATEWIELGASLAAELPVEVISAGPGGDLDLDGATLEERYGIGPEGAVLIRPDGHVGWRSAGPRSTAAHQLVPALGSILDWASLDGGAGSTSGAARGA